MNVTVVNPPSWRVTIADGGTQITLTSSGVQGPAGPPGSGASLPWVEDHFVLNADQTVFPLSQTPFAGSMSLFVNGLRQSKNTFTVAGMAVAVTGFVPTSGDVVDFSYQQQGS